MTQASYRITVSDAGRQLWDSGTVASANCSQIVYSGAGLPAYTLLAWTVEWASSTGATSAPAASTFETGPLALSDWKGAGWLVGRPKKPAKHGQPWPAGRMQLRAAFTLPKKPIAFARAYVAATGCAHLEVNGRVPRPDLRGICPWPTAQLATVRYVTHDITALLSPGANALGMLLGGVPHGKAAAPLASQV